MTTDPIVDPAHAIPAASQLRRSRTRWRLIAFMALVVAILAGLGRFGLEAGLRTEGIARIVVNDVIQTDPSRLEAIEQLAADPNVKAVIVAINSPGGSTAGGEELFMAIRALAEQKPVVAYFAEIGASAAYMAALGADRIFTRRLSIVGSIGVLFQTTDASKLFQTIGVDLDKVASGPLKAEPDLDETMAPEVRASLQALVDDSFGWFVDLVAERRGLARDDVLKIADGRILTGQQALAAKLVDALGGEAEAIAWLETERGIAPDLPVATWYPLPDEWSRLERWLGGAARSAIGLPADGPIVLDGLVSLWHAGR